MTDFREAIKGAVEGVGRRLDAWVNLSTGLGGSRDRTIGAQIAKFRPLTAEELLWLYHGHDLPATIVDRLPTDALSRGFAFEGNPELDKAASKWDLAARVLDGRIWARLGGSGGILIGCDDAAPHLPLRLESIQKGQLKYLLAIERSEIAAIEYDQRLNSPTYGEPAMYSIGTIERKVHPSRVVLFPGARTSPRMRQRIGTDLSVLQRPYEILRDSETVWRSVMGMMQDASQAVFKIKGLMDMVSGGHSGVLLDRMELVNAARSVSRAVLLDAEGEDYGHVGAANLGGVDAIVMRTFQRLAASADMPVSILLGMSASGLNASGAGDSDIRIWTARVVAERALLERAILYLGGVIARDCGAPLPRGIVWPGLWDMTDRESADLEQVRATTAQTRITAAITTPEDESRILAGEDLAMVLRDRLEIDELAALDPDDDAIALDLGSVWIDTHTRHRVQVRSTGEGRVYFVDLDSDDPERQRAWVRRVFLARCYLAPDPEDALPSVSAPQNQPLPSTTPPTE